MFNTKTPAPNPKLEEAIDQALTALQNHTPESEEYATIVKQLDLLHKMKPTPVDHSVGLDNLLPVIANLLGIGMVMGHERAHVITTKAFGLLTKPKV